jgi:hypothetical protein
MLPSQIEISVRMGYQDGDCTREPARTIDDAVDEVEASGI